MVAAGWNKDPGGGVGGWVKGRGAEKEEVEETWKGSLGSNLTSDVHILHLWLIPWDDRTGSVGELRLTGTELILHAPLALQGIMTPSGVFEGPRSHTFHSAL